MPLNNPLSGTAIERLNTGQREFYNSLESQYQIERDIKQSQENYNDARHTYPLTTRDSVFNAIDNYQSAVKTGLDATQYALQLIDLGLTVGALARLGINLLPHILKNKTAPRTVNRPGLNTDNYNDPFSYHDRSYNPSFNPRNITNTSLPVSGGRTVNNPYTPFRNTFDISDYQRALKPSLNRPFGC